MTILTKDAVGDYPLPIGGMDAVAPTDEITITVISTTVSVMSIINTGGWGSEIGTRAWYDENWPGKYVWVPVDPALGFWNITYDYYGYEVTYVVIPATAGSPAVPSAVDAVALAAYFNEGWNTWARSIGRLDPGQCLEFAVSTASTGAIVLVAAPNKEGQFGTASTNQGFVIDRNQIYLLDSGGVVTTFGTNTETTRLFIYRLMDGSLAFRVGDYFHINSVVIPPQDLGYVYGMLFRAFDSITFAQITSATIESVTDIVYLSASGTLMAATGTAASMSGTGRLITVVTTLIETTMTGTGYLFSEVDALTRGAATLPLYIGLGADYAYGFGASDLPSYTQPQIMPEYGWATLTYFSGYAYGSDHDVGGGASVLPKYCGLGADYAYGFGADGSCGSNGLLPLYTGGGIEGIDGGLVLFDVVRATATTTLAIDLVLVLTSTGTIESSFSMTREQALAFMSSLAGNDQYTFVGTFSMSMLSSLRGSTPQVFQIREQADLISNGVVWVVNLANSASTQYEQYGFNSFFVRGGIAYGVANNGIYKLDGSTDSGEIIEAFVMTGKSDFTTKNVKTLPAVYLGISSTDEVVLKVDADGASVYYTARSMNSDLENQRVDIGKGLRGRYWQFTLLNAGGCDFDLEGINFTPVNTSRSI